MKEYTFWMIYFTLCKRYLPGSEEQEQLHAAHSAAATAAAAAAAGPSSTAADDHTATTSAPQTTAASLDLPTSSVQHTAVEETKDTHRQPASESASGVLLPICKVMLPAPD